MTVDLDAAATLDVVACCLISTVLSVDSAVVDEAAGSIVGSLCLSGVLTREASSTGRLLV